MRVLRGLDDVLCVEGVLELPFVLALAVGGRLWEHSTTRVASRHGGRHEHGRSPPTELLESRPRRGEGAHRSPLPVVELRPEQLRGLYSLWDNREIVKKWCLL